MAPAVKLFVSYGAVERGVWCDVHHIPHMFRYKTYRITESGNGDINIYELKTVERCDLR